MCRCKRRYSGLYIQISKRLGFQRDGRGYSSIHSIGGVLRPAFQLAVDDDLIRKNPFVFELAAVIVNDSVTREAITRKQERELLKFTKRVDDEKNGIHNSKLVRKARDYIMAHIGETITTEDLAKETGLNRSYLCTLFTEETTE